jgi:hypothetical protein
MKKDYQAPELIEIGSVEDLTLSGGTQTDDAAALGSRGL